LKTLRQIPLTCAPLRSIGPMMIIKKFCVGKMLTQKMKWIVFFGQKV